MSLILPFMGLRGPGRYIPTAGEGDGGFEEPPVVTTTVTGDVTIKGKVKPGSFGKFVYPLATVAGGRKYTIQYTPQFSQLAQQGKLALVGFGLKSGNDFHIVGLRGNGASGLTDYKVYGTPPNGWNKDTGHTVSAGSAPANGTQAGPNWIQIGFSSDGTTYTFRTSANGTTWSDEYTAATPTPFTDADGVPTFGVALWFNNSDAGPFSIAITQFSDAAEVVSDPFFSNVVLLAGFNGAHNDATYTAETGQVATLTGASRLSNTQAKFATTSFGCANTSPGTFPASTNWNLSPTNNTAFTIEWWQYIANTVSTVQTLFIDPGLALRTGDAGAMSYYWNDSGGGGHSLSQPAAGLLANQWQAFCFEKNGSGTINFYVDGTRVLSSTPANSTLLPNTGTLSFGPPIAGQTCYMDELRITKNVARYNAASYAVQTAPFPRS